MDSDEDDAPLTFRRGGQNEKPRAAAPQAQRFAANAGAAARPADGRSNAPGGAQRRPSGDAVKVEDNLPIAKRCAANGASAAGPSKRPAQAAPPANAKKAKVEPAGSAGAPSRAPSGLQHIRQDQGRAAGQAGAVGLSANGPRPKEEPSGNGGRASSNGPAAHANQRRQSGEEEEEEEEEGEEEKEEEEVEEEAEEAEGENEEEFEEVEEEEEEDEEEEDEDEDDGEYAAEDDVPISQRGSSTPTKSPAPKAKSPASGDKKKRAPSGGGGAKKKEDNTVKWSTLEHNGVIFPPAYTPHGISILYDRKPVTLTPAQEEVATMFAVMRETEYATKERFLSNFWEDWRKLLGPRHTIQRLDLCDFTPIWEWHCQEKEKKKQISTEEKKRIKEEKMKAEEKYMWAVIDGVKEKVGNFRVEPPGLFRGRGEHPKMGKLKRRIMPEDITINLGKKAPIPECPIPGHKWREVRNDNTVTWLAYWADPINPKEFKYVFLAASSRLKGLSDKEKYEKARKLKGHIDKIRTTYTKAFSSKDEVARQIAVATYLIDRLALRAGNEKDDDEADTVGCCSLKVEHVTRVPPRSLQFDFLGKDSIRYFNTVEVEAAVYAAIGEFQKRKRGDEDLFNRLDTSKLNAHLKEIMPGLTAKVFRTYNASITLDRLLQDTVGNDVKEKVADYQRANKEVAILCNHQRTVSKAHAGQMEKLQTKVSELEASIEELEDDLSRVRKGKPPLERPGKEGSSKTPSVQTLEKKLATARARLDKMKLDMSIKDELKTVALGTSKINYLDPRITVAWCKRHEVPIEKIFNKSLLAKFAWSMDVEPDFRF